MAAASRQSAGCAAAKDPRNQRDQSAGRLHPRSPALRLAPRPRPIEKIGYSIFIYDLTGDEEGLMKLKETYGVAGLPQDSSIDRATTNLPSPRNNRPRS